MFELSWEMIVCVFISPLLALQFCDHNNVDMEKLCITTQLVKVNNVFTRGIMFVCKVEIRNQL